MLFTSQVIASASGSAGGLTASRNRFGMYFRARAVPVNPNTTFQQSVRALLATFATRWGTITVTQRDAWDVYATNTTVVNKLGQSVTLTGFMQYVRSNTARVQAGLTVVDDAPTVFGLPTFAPVVCGFAAPAGVPSMQLFFDDAEAWANEDGGALMFSASRPFSPTINFFAGPFRFWDVVLGSGTVSPTSPIVFSDPPFPFAITQKMACHARVCRADGRLSSAQIDVRVVV